MRIFKISDKLEIKRSAVCSGKGVFAKDKIKEGDVLVDIEAKIVKRRVDYALQTGESSFLLADYIDNFINHSCSPNVFIKLYKDNKKRVSFVALKNIKKGDELFWNFNTTEWDFNPGFICKCGSKNCVGTVRGMKYLTEMERKQLLPLSTPYILEKIKGCSK